MVLVVFTTYTSWAQGWILPLGNVEAKKLEKTSDGGYIVAYTRGFDNIVLKVDENGNTEDSLELSEALVDFTVIGNNIYMLTYSSSNMEETIYKSDNDLIDTSYLYSTYASTTGDTFYDRFLNSYDQLVLIGIGAGFPNCYYNLKAIDTINAQATDLVSCFGNLQSGDGERYWQWNNRYITTMGESKWLSVIPGNPIDTFPITGANKYVAIKGNRVGGISNVFKLLDTNFNTVASLTESDLVFSIANMEARAGLCSTADGGFYYSAYRTDMFWFPYIILGKIDMSGNLEWKRGFINYVFQYPIAITESHEENSCIILARDEIISTSNTHSYLIKTNDDGSIGLEEESGIKIIAYPNPAIDYVNISIPFPHAVSMEVYSVEGKSVYTGSLMPGESNPLDVRSFSPGLYHVQMICDGKIYYSRFVRS